jgi:hypothetical protein
MTTLGDGVFLIMRGIINDVMIEPPSVAPVTNEDGHQGQQSEWNT